MLFRSYLSKADSLSVYYIGCRCEVGVTGYLYRPWWVILSWKDGGLLAVVFVTCILLFFVRKSFVKKKPVAMENALEHPSHFLQLEEGVSFDVDLRMLKKGECVVLLTPQLAQLLQGFLEARYHRLSTDEIQLLLWPHGNGTSNKVHQSVKIQILECLLVHFHQVCLLHVLLMLLLLLQKDLVYWFYILYLFLFHP